jgi:hypothetical protein
MPSPTEILAGVTAVANEQINAAVLWHVALAAAILAFLRGWSPARRTAALLLAALPVSVSGFAFAYGNPFNGSVFALLAVLVLLTARNTSPPMAASTPALFWLGAGMVAFGWVYPHFLEGKPLIAYAIAAPTGLIPCPTLSVMTGITLLKGDLFSRRWAITLAVFALFYGVFGILRLGVWLDVALLAGAIGLAGSAWQARHVLTAQATPLVTRRSDRARRPAAPAQPR